MTATRQKDGFRWSFSQDPYTGRWRLIAQQRCTLESGRVYYRYGTVYEFDSETEAKEFARDQPAKEWY